MAWIKRHQLFEFCDAPWLPAVLREGLMDCLNQMHARLRAYARVAPNFARWSAQFGPTEVLDLASGGGEQIASMLRYADESGLHLPKIVLSDLFPQREVYRQLVARHGGDRLGFVMEPVALAALPAQYRVLSIFSAFHHFPPPAARALLEEVVARRDGLCIFEMTRNSLWDLFAMLPGFFLNMLAPFQRGRFRWSKFLLSVPLPVIPFITSHDGVVSVIRSYSFDEIRALLPPGTEKEFVIEQGSAPWGRVPFSRATYFLLTRKSARLGT